MSIDRDNVLEALTPEAVAAHYGIEGRWSGRWMRSRQCPLTPHGSLAFGLSRDGYWHCHACDRGGDLLDLVAAGEGLDTRRDFDAVVRAAAAIAGVDETRSSEDRDRSRRVSEEERARQRQAAIAERSRRIEQARRRAPWVWQRLEAKSDDGERYLVGRGLGAARDLEELRFTPGALPRGPRDSELEKTRRMLQVPSVCIAVRSIVDNALIDVRARRLEPREGHPKILGIPGGVTWPDGELAGCYGHPASLGLGDVFVVEGWADYLAARMAWPSEDILGAVDVGQLRVVAAHAAAHCLEVDSQLVIIGQDDGEDGPAGRGVDRAAAAAMTAGLPPSAIVWLDCRSLGVKDLADLARHGGGLDEAVDHLARMRAAP